MIYWLIIIIGIILLSLSLSNPFYDLLIKKYLNITPFLRILFRILLFFFFNHNNNDWIICGKYTLISSNISIY